MNTSQDCQPNAALQKNKKLSCSQLAGFFVGCHQPSDAKKIDRPLCISIDRLKSRENFECEKGFILDCNGYQSMTRHACHRLSVEDYASLVRHYSKCLGFRWASSQDFMCEKHALIKTGLSVADHQALTTDRLRQLLALVDVVPTIQGSSIAEYDKHAHEIKKIGTFDVVAVGSVCGRRVTAEINQIYMTVKNVFPKSIVHGFGVKTRSMFESSDSMAWSLNAMLNGRDSNSWKEAQKFYDKVTMRQNEKPTPTKRSK